MTSTKVSKSSKARLPKRSSSARSTRATPPSDSSDVSSPWEELKSLKAALADLQMKRLSALRLYQEERTLRQQETDRAEQLAAKIQALESSNSETPTAKAPEPRDLAPITDSKQAPEVRQQSNGLPLREPNFESESDNNCKPDTSTNVQNSASVKNDSHISIQGHTAQVAMVARLPPGLPTSLTWHSLSITNVLPPPPEVVVLLSPFTANPPSYDESRTDDSSNNKDSSNSQRAPTAVVSNGFNDNNSSGKGGLGQSVPGSEENDEENPLESKPNDFCGDANKSDDLKKRETIPDPPRELEGTSEAIKQPNSTLGSKASSSNNSPICNSVEVGMVEGPSCGLPGEAHHRRGETLRLTTGSDESPPEVELTELRSLREKLRIAEIEAARASQELKQSTKLIADMKQQLDASTSACKDMIDTITEQEKTITSLSQKAA